MDKQEIQQRLLEEFGSREGHLGFQLLTLSSSRQPCDVTFFNRKPILDVRVDQKLAIAMMYGAGAKKLQEMLSRISFSDGSVASFGEIWTVVPMPVAGLTKDELSAVDLSEAEEVWGANGETLRKMVRDMYKCETREEEDRYLRRFIAS